MEKIKKHDFIEIEYTGIVKESNLVFDTTDNKIAKENNLHSHDNYSPVIICVGEEQVLKGIDKNLEGKEVGNEYNFVIKPEDGFGNKNAQLIQLIPTNKFRQQNLQPMPGMQLNIDGMLGTVKTVSGGRTLVDFNHPLAGKELSYKVKINRKITDDKEKVTGILTLSLGTKDFNVEINENSIEVVLKLDLSREAKGDLSKKILKLIPTLKKIEFKVEKNKNK